MRILRFGGRRIKPTTELVKMAVIWRLKSSRHNQYWRISSRKSFPSTLHAWWFTLRLQVSVLLIKVSQLSSSKWLWYELIWVLCLSFGLDENESNEFSFFRPVNDEKMNMNIISIQQSMTISFFFDSRKMFFDISQPNCEFRQEKSSLASVENSTILHTVVVVVVSKRCAAAER